MIGTDAPPDRRCALVVGGVRGIGLATARRLSDDGLRVTATWYRTRPPVDANPAVAWRHCDTTDAASVGDLFAEAEGTGPFDVVVANAAVLRDRLSSRLTDDDFRFVTDTNLAGTFRVARAALASMTRRRWGRLVLVSSAGGWYGFAGQANYAAAKAGLTGMARALAREVGPRQVTVNVVVPGPIDTELISAMPPRFLESWIPLVPAQRLGSVNEVASTIAYLASERSGAVTGALVPVDGGMLS